LEDSQWREEEIVEIQGLQEIVVMVMTVLSQYYRLTWTQLGVRMPRVLGCILISIPARRQMAMRVKLSSQYNKSNKRVESKSKKNEPEGIRCIINILFLASSDTSTAGHNDQLKINFQINSDSLVIQKRTHQKHPNRHLDHTTGVIRAAT